MYALAFIFQATCRESLDVYKSIQTMLSSVENTTYGQIQDVASDGAYIVKVPERRIPSNISDLVVVEIRGARRSQTAKTTYSLDDLKDLQSKLALILGDISGAKIQHVATAFWQVWLSSILHACMLHHAVHDQYLVHNRVSA